MVATDKVNLPTEEDLTVQEINLSISALRAGAFHLGKYCEHENNEFMLCKQEESDPRVCLTEGINVTQCALSFFQSVKQSCFSEFQQYAKCLNNSSGDMRFSQCRNTQAVLDQCIKENIGNERPDYGYFCRIKVHHTDRPAPVAKPTVYSDSPHKLMQQEHPTPPANFGSRNVI